MVDMKLEVDIIPVTDVDRATHFYESLGWRKDDTPPTVVQFTPPGSWCSVQFGANLTSAEPGSAKGYLIVDDIEAARDKLNSANIPVSDVYHIGQNGKESGLDPDRDSYRSFIAFNDPDGNKWVFQEITTRLPGRVLADETTFPPRATSRMPCAARRPLTASMRSARARRTLAGRTGTPRTWLRRRRVGRCRPKSRGCNRHIILGDDQRRPP